MRETMTPTYGDITLSVFFTSIDTGSSLPQCRYTSGFLFFSRYSRVVLTTLFANDSKVTAGSATAAGGATAGVSLLASFFFSQLTAQNSVSSAANNAIDFAKVISYPKVER